MSNRGPSYGLSREVKLKLAKKYDKQMEEKQRIWISNVTKIDLPPISEQTFHTTLKDGLILCALAENLLPGCIKKPFPHVKMLNSFRCMENISAFLNAAQNYFGVPQASLFQTCDLYDASNMTQVQICIQAFASHACAKGLTSCDFAVKVAEKEVRVWSEAKLKAGDGIIGLQMGSNKGANQKGMSFGTCRPLYDKKYTGLGENSPQVDSNNLVNSSNGYYDNQFLHDNENENPFNKTTDSEN